MRSKLGLSLLILTLMIPGGVFVHAWQGEDETQAAWEKNHPEIAIAQKACRKTDQMLNETYRLLLDVYDDGNDAKVKLKATQLAWIKYRDLAVGSENACNPAGSDVSRIEYYISMESLTWERLQRIGGMLKHDYDRIISEDPLAAKSEKAMKIEQMLERLKTLESERKPSEPGTTNNAAKH